jgi:glycosyltransferase involved in cell wall biosynthesis
MNPVNTSCELSIIIPVIGKNYISENLFYQIHDVLKSLLTHYEIFVITDHPTHEISQILQNRHVEIISFSSSKYGTALQAGFDRAIGEFIIVMDADQKNLTFLRYLWEARFTADVVIASRYISGG